MSLECENAKITLANKLVAVMNDLPPNVSDHNQNKEKSESILEWINTGKDNNIIKTLLTTPDSNKNFPIWWSGFYIENSEDNSIVKEMKEASLIVNGYSSVDTLFTLKAFNEQKIFLNACKDKPNFEWAKYYSITYTNLALQKNPLKIGLLVNKSNDNFINTYFLNTELPLIYNHYKTQKKLVTMYIFNKKNNCNDIIRLINNKITEINKNIPNTPTINFKCSVCENTLVNCANAIKIDKNSMSGGLSLNPRKYKKTDKKRKTHKRINSYNKQNTSKKNTSKKNTSKKRKIYNKKKYNNK